MQRRIRICLLVGSTVLWAGAATAYAPDDSIICDRAAVRAAQETGVPLDVLRAITRTETGRTGPAGLEPWPWTVNMEGKGKWFENRDDAQAFVDRHHTRGARSFDVGCFQINYKWHGDGFSSIEEMFEPLPNARYAAGFLADLYREFGDWSKAAGAYHSRTPKYASRYKKRFDRILARLEPGVPEPLPVPATTTVAELAQPRENRFPLLTGEGRRGAASLVPLKSGTEPFLRAPSQALFGWQGS